MTIKSTPPASSNFAVIPVPAPAPIMGRWDDISLRSRFRICCLVCAIGCFCLLNELNDPFDGLGCEFRIVDVSIHLDEWDPGSQILLNRIEHRLIGRAITKWLALSVQHGDAAQ